MLRSRRKFLRWALAGAAVSAAGGAYWINTSQRRVARWLRQIIADSKREILPSPAKPNPAAWNDNDITIAWLGHATVLIDFYGVKILTDPAFGLRVGISLGLGTAGPKRYVASALSSRELPPVDVILLSHAHMDHMDLPSLRKLPKGAFTVTARDTSDILDGTRKNVSELGWGETAELAIPKRGALSVEAFEVKHWGERWPSEKARGYNGYVLRREGKAILFGGDTADTPLFKDLASKAPYEAAIMPIGAYEPWIWNHCSPEQAVKLANEAGAKYIVPVHHQTFRLSHEPMTEPIDRFVAALDSEPERVALQQIGETFVCPKT